MRCRGLPALPIVAVLGAALLSAAEPTPAERGRKALTGRAFTTAPWVPSAYDDVWKHWQPAPAERPADYDRAFQEHYGLFPAPYENGRYPMGLREGKGLLGAKGIATDCLICHGGSILGKSVIGLGNASLDLQSLFADLGQASHGSGRLPFTFSHVRGTSEAGAMAVYLHSLRNPDLSLHYPRRDFKLRDDLCEDTPAWWLLKKKKTMYYTGTTPARSVRSIMQFMLSPTVSRATFEREEPTFTDLQAFILSLGAPKYPFPIDRPLAAKGEQLFGEHCARCHGTYGPNPTYPNKVVPLDVIGTDRNRFDGIPHDVGEFYNQSWFAQETADGYKVTEPVGYQAPPLDGVWATAPYLHNGSVPTLYDVLNSKTRPKVFTRSYRTEADAYDQDKVGWKVQGVSRAPADATPFERRKVYDTTQPGRSNGGHTFGDDLRDDERRAVVEYLKTL